MNRSRVFPSLGAALAAVLLTAAPALAAPAATDEAPLSLVEAVSLARDHSLAAQLARQQILTTQANRQVTVSNALPTLGIRSAATYNQLPANSGLGALFGSGSGGGLVGFPASGTYVDTTISGSVPIFDAFATRDALRVSDLQLSVGELQLAQAEQEAMTNAAVAYFEVLRAEGLAKVAETTLKQSQEQLRLGDLRLKAGTGTRAEVLQLRANVANAQASLLTSRNTVNLQRLTLANALNAPVAYRALDAAPVVPAIKLDPGRDLKQAVEQRPELQIAKQQEEGAYAQADLEGRAAWPTLTANSSYAQRNLSSGQFQANVTMNWNVFDGFRVRNRVEAARSQAQTAGVQLEQTRQRLAIEVRQYYQNKLDAQSRVATAQEGLESAQEAYRLAQKRFEVGLSTIFELTDVQTTLTQASNNYVQALNDARVAEIRLARSAGLDLGKVLGASRPLLP